MDVEHLEILHLPVPPLNDLSWQLLRFIAQQGSVHLRKASSFGRYPGCQSLPTLHIVFTIYLQISTKTTDFLRTDILTHRVF